MLLSYGPSAVLEGSVAGWTLAYGLGVATVGAAGLLSYNNAGQDGAAFQASAP